MRCHRVCCNTCNGKCKSVQFVGRRFDLSQRYVVPLLGRIRDNMNYRTTGNIGTIHSLSILYIMHFIRFLFHFLLIVLIHILIIETFLTLIIYIYILYISLIDEYLVLFFNLIKFNLYECASNMSWFQKWYSHTQVYLTHDIHRFYQGTIQSSNNVSH